MRHSASENLEARASSAFARLDTRLQRWIWGQNWTELRDIQEAAIHVLLEGVADVIISAATASGKTEAAFLPICSRIARTTANGIRALYVSPLKALINDQYDRLDRLCGYLEIPVHRWHGDVAYGKKSALLTQPSGILLITPESLEALFVRHGPEIENLFAHLAYVVVDELHSFIGTERGRQLQSLLHRVEVVVRRRIPRIGLSATLSKMPMAAEFLRPDHAEQIQIIESQAAGQELLLQLRGYSLPSCAKDEEAGSADSVPSEIVRHLFDTLRGTDNLIFPNRRQTVEGYADQLRELCAAQNVPNVFLPHHGNLSKSLREEAESRLKDKAVAVNLICTTTLELGIDVGSVHSIAQIGVPPSVANLRQRVGRSGRRGEPAILRVYIAESELDAGSHPQDGIRAELVQAIAAIHLLIRRWCEPPTPAALHPSTLVQQTLSLIAQVNGSMASDLWHILCRTGPFGGIDQQMYGEFLRSLARHDLIMQSLDGTLLLGSVGERIVNDYHFFAAFAAGVEYSLVADGKMLGTLPIYSPLKPNDFLVFGGRRWQVISVDRFKKAILLSPAPKGTIPLFGGSGFPTHMRVQQEMLAIYTSAEVPGFLDTKAKELLFEGRANFARYDLATSPMLRCGDDMLLFCWLGDRARQTLVEQLRQSGLDVSDEGLAILCRQISREEIENKLRLLIQAGPADAQHLVAPITKQREKYDGYLPNDLFTADFAGKYLDTQGAWQLMQNLVKA